MDKILRYFKTKGGFARMGELREQAFQTREIARLVRDRQIEKVKSGLYKLPDVAMSSNINASLVEVSHAVPKGIIALASALAHHELTTFVSSEIYVAIPLSDKPPRLKYPPTRIFYFPERFYIPGIEEIKTAAGTVRIYCQEKTICDMFRYRNRLGENLALEGLKRYLGRRGANVKLLYEFADICRVKTIMLPYIKAMVT